MESCTCIRCGGDFKAFFSNKKTGKKSKVCKPCIRKYDKSHYDKNKHKYRKTKNDKRKDRAIKIRSFIISLLKKSKCMDCGNNDWRVLEFDHRDMNNKSMNIADATKYSLEKTKKEIEKCDIVCSNCHRIRTITQLGYYKEINLSDFQ